MLITYNDRTIFVYLLGHVAIGYVLAWLVASGRKESLVLWAVFLMSILPDFDVLFYSWGLVHGSYTHTLVLLVPVSIILVVWRIETLPYVIALLSHVVVDASIGPLRLFFPLSGAAFSLNLKMSSNIDAVIEIGFLILMVVLMRQNNDLVRILGGSRSNLWMIAPLVPVVGSMFMAAFRIGVWRGWTIISYASSAAALETITIGHIVLVILMTISLLMAIISIFSVI